MFQIKRVLSMILSLVFILSNITFVNAETISAGTEVIEINQYVKEVAPTISETDLVFELRKESIKESKTLEPMPIASLEYPVNFGIYGYDFRNTENFIRMSYDLYDQYHQYLKTNVSVFNPTPFDENGFCNRFINSTIPYYSDTAVSYIVITKLEIMPSPTVYETTYNSTINAWVYGSLPTFTITYNTNGGTSLSTDTKEINTTYTLPTGTTKTGYSFGGWYYDSGLTSTVGATLTVSGNTTLYAKWNANNYTVTYNTNGGSAISTDTKAYGTTYTLPTVTIKTGYTFGGWYYDSGLTSQVGANYTVGASNVTLYAKWSINNYTVTYNTNGGSAISTDTKAYGTTYTLPTGTTKTGYTFGGWYYDVGLTSQVGANYTVGTSNVTLYAKWNANNYTIAYNTNGGSAISTDTKAYGTTYTLPTTTTKTGYSFGWWYSNSGLTTPVGSTYTVGASNVTLYAKWNANTYTVNFNANGGSVGTTSKSVTYSSTYGTLPTPTKTGYSFNGWYTSSSGGSKITTSTTVAITSTQTLYAQWSINSYVVSFVSDGETLGSISKVYGSTYTLPIPTKLYFVFGGWYRDSGFNSAVGTDFIIEDSNITFYAKWYVDMNPPIYGDGEDETELIEAPHRKLTVNSSIVGYNATLINNDTDTVVGTLVNIPVDTFSVEIAYSGNYTLIASKENYATLTQPISIIESTSIDLNFFLATTPPIFNIDPLNPIEPMKKYVVVNSNVDGYDVVLTDKSNPTYSIEKTNCNFVEAIEVPTFSTYSIEVKKNDYITVSDEVVVKNTNNSIDVSLYVETKPPIYVIDPLNPIGAMKKYVVINSNVDGYNVILTDKNNPIYPIIKSNCNSVEAIEVPTFSTYSIQVSKEDYVTVNSEVVVENTNNSIDIKMYVEISNPIFNSSGSAIVTTPPKKYIQINSNIDGYDLTLTDKHNRSYTINKKSCKVVEIIEVPTFSTYSLEVSKEDYITVNDEVVVVDTNNSIDIRLDVEKKSPIFEIDPLNPVVPMKKYVVITSNIDGYNVVLTNKNYPNYPTVKSNCNSVEVIEVPTFGTYTVEVSKDNYITVVDEIEVIETKNTIDIKLYVEVINPIETVTPDFRPSPIVPDEVVDAPEEVIDEIIPITDETSETDNVIEEVTEDTEVDETDLSDLTIEELEDLIDDGKLTGEDLDNLLNSGFITFDEYVSLMGMLVANELKFNQFNIPIGSSIYRIEYPEHTVEYDSLVKNYINKSTQATMLCLRALINSSDNGEMQWNAEFQKTDLVFERRKVRVSFVAGSNIMLLNGHEVEMLNSTGVPLNTEVSNGRTMVPFRYVSEFMNFAVRYDKESHQATAINKKNIAS